MGRAEGWRIISREAADQGQADCFAMLLSLEPDRLLQFCLDAGNDPAIPADRSAAVKSRKHVAVIE